MKAVSALILFARDPRREAEAKGFAPSAVDLFATFATGWQEVASRAGIRFGVATPAEDRLAWRRVLPDDSEVVWIAQRGRSLGERLEGAARHAAKLGGHTVIVGGDVAPSSALLAQALENLASGADAVMAPAADGGVSLVALLPADADLLRGLHPRRRDAAAFLHSALEARGRRVILIEPATDVDGRGALRALARELPARLLPRSLIRQILTGPFFVSFRTPPAPADACFALPAGLRAPPLAA